VRLPNANRRISTVTPNSIGSPPSSGSNGYARRRRSFTSSKAKRILTLGTDHALATSAARRWPLAGVSRHRRIAEGPVKPVESIKRDWKWGTSEGNRQMDRLPDRQLTFREKLEWLEQAETLSLRLGANRESQSKDAAAIVVEVNG
jgi:hypothetical protein